MQLAAAYRIVVHLGWQVLIGKAIALHVPNEPGQFLFNPFGPMWLLQRACEVHLASQPLGRLRPSATPVLEGCVRDSLNFNSPIRRRAGRVRRHAAAGRPGRSFVPRLTRPRTWPQRQN